MNNLLSTLVSFETTSILDNLEPNFSITAITKAPRKAIVHKTSYMIKKKGVFVFIAKILTPMAPLIVAQQYVYLAEYWTAYSSRLFLALW